MVPLFVEVTKHIHLRESCGVGSDGGGGGGGSDDGGFMKPMVILEIGGDWGYTYAGKGPAYMLIPICAQFHYAYGDPHMRTF